jgi:hypothetical protein
VRGAAALVAVLFALAAAATATAGETAADDVRALLRQDRWEEALATARRGVERRPGDRALAAALGAAQLRAGLLEQAEVTLAAAVAGDPSARALVDLGRIRQARGQDAEAAALMQRAVELAPDDAEVLYWAAGAATTVSDAVHLLERYRERAADDAGQTDRLEAVAGTLRLYAALGERRVWIEEQRPARVELPLRALSSGPGRLDGYVLEATAGPRGKRLRLLLDTGSPGLFLVHRAARKRGFEPLAEETAFGGGGDRRHPSTRGLLSSLAFGELRFRDALVATTGREIDPTGRYHGLIGLSAFRGYRVVLDLQAPRLILEPPGAELPGEVRPYWIVSGQLTVTVAAEGGPAGLFLLDTGATTTLVSLRYADGVPGALVAERAAVRGFGGRLEGARVVRGLELVFGGSGTGGGPLRGVDLSLRSRLGGVEISGFLGLDLLRDRRFVIDTVSQRVAVIGATTGD